MSSQAGPTSVKHLRGTPFEWLVSFLLALPISSCKSSSDGGQIESNAIAVSQNFNGEGIRPNPGETPRELTKRLIEANQFSYFVNDQGTRVELRHYNLVPDPEPRSAFDPVKQTLRFSSFTVYDGGAWVLIPDLNFEIGASYKRARRVIVELADKKEVWRISPRYTLYLDPWNPRFPPGFIQDLYLVEAGDVKVQAFSEAGLDLETDVDSSSVGANLSIGDQLKFHSEFEWAVVASWTPRTPSNPLRRSKPLQVPFEVEGRGAFFGDGNLNLHVLETVDSGGRPRVKIVFQGDTFDLAVGDAIIPRAQSALRFISCDRVEGRRQCVFEYVELDEKAAENLGFNVEFLDPTSVEKAAVQVNSLLKVADPSLFGTSKSPANELAWVISNRSELPPISRLLGTTERSFKLLGFGGNVVRDESNHFEAAVDRGVNVQILALDPSDPRSLYDQTADSIGENGTTKRGELQELQEIVSEIQKRSRGVGTIELRLLHDPLRYAGWIRDAGGPNQMAHITPYLYGRYATFPSFRFSNDEAVRLVLESFNTLWLQSAIQQTSRPVENKPRIVRIRVDVQTRDDNKEDSQFEIEVKQGGERVAFGAWGASENWDDGSTRQFVIETNSEVVGEPIEVFATLRDGPWGQSNHWNCTLAVTAETDAGKSLRFERSHDFKTSANMRTETISLGTQRF